MSSEDISLIYQEELLITEIRKGRNYLNIGKLNGMETKCTTFKDEQIIESVQRFKDVCPKFRSVKGDGNCFYRALAHLFFETIFLKQDYDTIQYKYKNVFLDHIRRIQEADFSQFLYIPEQYQELNFSTLKSILLAGLKFCYLENQKEVPREMLFTLLNESYQFDLALILYVRSQALAEFDREQQKYVNQEQRDKQRSSMTMFGSEAQQIDIEMTLQAFQLNANIHQINQQQLACATFINQHALFTIDLFFRPGHYDCCYREEMLNALKTNYKFGKSGASSPQKSRKLSGISSNVYTVGVEKSNEELQLEIEELKRIIQEKDDKIDNLTSQVKALSVRLVDTKQSSPEQKIITKVKVEGPSKFLEQVQPLNTQSEQQESIFQNEPSLIQPEPTNSFVTHQEQDTTTEKIERYEVIDDPYEMKPNVKIEREFLSDKFQYISIPKPQIPGMMSKEQVQQLQSQLAGPIQQHIAQQKQNQPPQVQQQSRVQGHGIYQQPLVQSKVTYVQPSTYTSQVNYAPTAGYRYY